jgi:radical SAM superfamily enzyme YgiQ (UPF0313 family)
MTSAIANAPARLVPLMRRAGFRYVFLGIENVLEQDLGFLRAAAKNARREHGRRVGNASLAAIEALHRHGIHVVGGLIVGSPDDTREAIEANLAFARRYVDWPYIQHPTPYPGTPMTRELRERELIISEQPLVRAAQRAPDDGPHLPGQQLALRAGPGEPAPGVRALPCDPPGRAELRLGSARR